MQHYVYSFLAHAIITLLIESGVIFILARKVFRVSGKLLPTSQLILAGVCVSLLTLPYVWFVFPALITNFVVAILIAEVSVVVAETLFYKMFLKISWKRAILFSFVANLVSYGVGELLHWLANR